MSRLGRVRRRPDHWSSQHDRARALAAERLTSPLDTTESTWLEGHLAECAECAAIAAAYERDRVDLRALRGTSPEPPRDLWARTAAAIEQESAPGGRRRGREGTSRGWHVPVGMLSGLAVVAVVVGVTALSGIWTPIPHGTLGGEDGSAPTSIGAAADGSPGAFPPATPFAVDAGDVAYLELGDGGARISVTEVDHVCPTDRPERCAAEPDPDAKQLAVEGNPRTVIGSPTDQQAIAVSRGTAGDEQVVVLQLPTGTAGPSAPASPAVEPSPTDTLPPSSSPSGDPTASPTAQATVEPSIEATTDPNETAQASPPDTTGEPTPTPAATASAAATIEPSATPTMAANLAIATGVEVVGDSAAFAPDGQWFAFTARPSTGGGPDVYAWHVRDGTARNVTNDGRSVFGSWADGRLVVSRPTAEGTGVPATVLIHPTTGVEEPVQAALWRPVVSPDGNRAVAWVGSVAPNADGTGWQPVDGRLELVTWDPEHGAGETGSGQVIAEGPVGDFDVRWDETGDWFGVWVADDADTSTGELSLFHVDPDSGAVSRPDGAPRDVAAAAGFALGEGRLAWATPAGSDGDGRRVRIAAWNSDEIGTVETIPGEDIIVIR